MVSGEGLHVHVKIGGDSHQQDLKKIGIRWDEVQEAEEDRQSW